MSLGKFISARRCYMNMTQGELAEMLHVSKSAVAKWETDRGMPDRENFKNLANLLNVSVDEMYHIANGDVTKQEHINITNEVIKLLESYGYKVTKDL